MRQRPFAGIGRHFEVVQFQTDQRHSGGDDDSSGQIPSAWLSNDNKPHHHDLPLGRKVKFRLYPLQAARNHFNSIMKLLVADFLFVEAHQEVNLNFISAISNFFNIDVISVNGYYDDQRKLFEERNIEIIDIKVNRSYGRIGLRMFGLKIINLVSLLLKQNTYNAVLILCFDTLSFVIYANKFNMIPIFLFHHKNIDELDNIIKRLLFSTYKNKVYHVVFENFFKEKLVKDYHVSDHRVFVIPHPVKNNYEQTCDIIYDCVGLCGSNNESFLSEIVNHAETINKYNLRIILRSRKEERHERMLKIIKGFMEKTSYNKLLLSTKTVVVPLPGSYKFRLSGSIYDALSRRKCVFTTSRFYATEYGKKYPGTCFYIDSVEQLIDNILQYNEESVSNTQFDNFIDDHSIDRVGQCINIMIRKVIFEND